MTRSTTRWAVLGVLSFGDGSGYRIKKTIEESLALVWSESYGQLYPTLAALQDEGLIAGRDEWAGKRRRRVYSLTDAGREALRAWLRTPMPPPPPRSSFLLKLILANELDTADVIELLETHRDEARDEAETLAALQRAFATGQAGADDPTTRWYAALTVSYGVAVDAAVAQWCDDAIAAVRAERGTP